MVPDKPKMLGEYPGIETDPDRMGGVPVMTGSRIPVSLIIADLAAGMSLAEIVDDLDLDHEATKVAVQSVASFIEAQAVHFDGG